MSKACVLALTRSTKSPRQVDVESHWDPSPGPRQEQGGGGEGSAGGRMIITIMMIMTIISKHEIAYKNRLRTQVL